MAFTDEEKQRIRYHAGFPAVQPAVGISFGVPKLIQTQFLLELAMEKILPIAENKIRQIIGVMDGIECRLIDAQDRLAAKSLDNLTMRVDETDALEAEYYRWGGRLVDTLGVPFYAYSNRYKRHGKSYAGTIPVRE